jgi:hypothetical protein
LGGDWVIKHRGCRRSARGFQAVLKDASISGVILDMPLVVLSLCSIGISYRVGGDEVISAAYIYCILPSLPPDEENVSKTKSRPKQRCLRVRQAQRAIQALKTNCDS